MDESIRVQTQPWFGWVTIMEDTFMKARELIDLLMLYDEGDEVQIEIYETLSDNYIDTTAAITIVEENVYVPTLRIDVEAGKFKALP